MDLDEPRARLDYRGSAISRARSLALKGLLVLGGALTLVSAFVVSLVFVAIGLAVVVAVGGYLWWQTRDLRRQMRARMQEQSHARSRGVVIEGEVISRDRTRR
jgi:protein-S-isoprenylcysteine O-methyltransferase Ste14